MSSPQDSTAPEVLKIELKPLLRSKTVTMKMRQLQIQEDSSNTFHLLAPHLFSSSSRTLQQLRPESGMSSSYSEQDFGRMLFLSFSISKTVSEPCKILSAQ